MEFENEITVEVDCSLEELMNILTKHNLSIIEEYDLNDIYMHNNYESIKDDPLETLKSCVLIRSIVEKHQMRNYLTYKYKEYNDNREVIKQGKVNLLVESVSDAKELMEALNYSELITINDHLIVMGGEDKHNLVIQLVNNHIYVEVEAVYERETIEELKSFIKLFNIPIKYNDYSVKKAEIAIREKFSSVVK